MRALVSIFLTVLCALCLSAVQVDSKSPWINRFGASQKKWRHLPSIIGIDSITTSWLCLFKTCCDRANGTAMGKPVNQNQTIQVQLDFVNPTICGIDPRTLPHPRIVGGQHAPRESWKWMAALFEWNSTTGQEKFFCGGTLITRRFVLSAAHCFQRKQKESLRVRVGVYKLGASDANERTYKVSDIYIHEGYKASNQENDIALLFIDVQVVFNDYIGPVCLPFTEEATFAGRVGLAAGWGRTQRGRASNELLEVALPILDNADCSQKLRRDYGKTYICAGGDAGMDTCDGDSGGPLAVHDMERNRAIQIGIVSYGLSLECATPTPAIYTRVSQYKNWIIQKIEPK